MKRFYIPLLIVVLMVSGCQAATPTTSPTAPTIDPAVLRVMVVSLAGTMVAETQAAWKSPTPAATETPAYTPTETVPPTATVPPPPTVSPLFALKDDGFYLVNIDIAPGVWRSTGTGDGCYWMVSTKTGEIMDNHFGMSGGTAYIPANGFQVQFQRCGTWEYLSAP